MLATLFLTLVAKGVLGNDMVARAMTQLDRVDGDIDTLMTRLAYIRTWTYITHRSDWTDSPIEWQDRARSIEDRLSDCLHSRLSERFVDKRAAHLSRRLKETKNLIASVKDDGMVLVEGEEVGQLDGFTFHPTVADGEDKAPILAAARRGLPDEIERRVRAFVASADPAFRLGLDGMIKWREAIIARLVKGDNLYAPRVELVASDLLSIDQTQRMNKRLLTFIATHVDTILGRLVALEAPDDASVQSTKPQPRTNPAAVKMLNNDEAAENEARENRFLKGQIPIQQKTMFLILAVSAKAPKPKQKTHHRSVLAGRQKALLISFLNGWVRFQRRKLSILFGRCRKMTSRVWRVWVYGLALRPFICRNCLNQLKLNFAACYLPSLMTSFMMAPLRLQDEWRLIKLLMCRMRIGLLLVIGGLASGSCALIWLNVLPCWCAPLPDRDILKLPKICCHWRGPRGNRWGRCYLILIVWLLARRQAKIRKSQLCKSLSANARHTHRKMTVFEAQISTRVQRQNKVERVRTTMSENRNLKSANRLRPNHKRSTEKQPDPNSPFAVLAALKTKV